MDRQKEYKFENKMKDCLAYFHLSPVWEKVLKGLPGEIYFLRKVWWESNSEESETNRY